MLGRVIFLAIYFYLDLLFPSLALALIRTDGELSHSCALDVVVGLWRSVAAREHSGLADRTVTERLAAALSVRRK